MSKRFDAKKHRAVFSCMNGYEFPAAKNLLAAFLLFQRDGEIQYENQKKTNHRIFSKYHNYVDGYRAHHIHCHRF